MYKIGSVVLPIERVHTEEKEFIYGCSLCDFGDDFIGNMWKHKLNNHPEQMKFKYNKADDNATKDLMFNILAEQSSTLMEEVACLQNGLKESFIQVTYDVHTV